MPRLQPSENPAPKQPTLQMPWAEAQRRINERIKLGQELLGRNVPTPDDVETLKVDFQKWDQYNFELMRRIDDTRSLERDYAYTPAARTTIIESWRDYVGVTQRNIRARLTALETILSKLELIPESPALALKVPDTAARPTGNRIFVVHGHDEEMKQTVARFLERLECVPIILHEQPDRGRTVIEKIVDYADVAFAVVLLTPDDVGAAADEPNNLKPRARQNVMFELGFFIGVLGRHNVCAVHRGGVEIPSDYHGVLWTAYDEADGWRTKLARELRAAGIAINADALLT